MISSTNLREAEVADDVVIFWDVNESLHDSNKYSIITLGFNLISMLRIVSNITFDKKLQCTFVNKESGNLSSDCWNILESIGLQVGVYVSCFCTVNVAVLLIWFRSNFIHSQVTVLLV